ncbi:MAG: sensor histidine kinase [Bacteroidota bacterium]
MLQFERLRSAVLAVFFGGLWVLLAVWVAPHVASQVVVPSTVGWGGAIPLMGFVGAVAVVEIAAYRSAMVRLAEGRGPSNAGPFVMTLLEVGGYASGATLLLTPPVATLDGPIVVLMLFVALSAFRLRLAVAVFTGAVAALGYLAIVDAAVGALGESAFWIAAMIAGSGICVGVLARAVGRAAQRWVHETKMSAQLQADLLDSVEATQARIGRELHDGVGSHLTGLSFYTHGLVRRLEKGKAITSAEMMDAAGMVDSSVQQVRRLARGLSPSEIESGGLPSALADVAAAASHATGVEVISRADTDLPRLASEVETHLHRIAQEAVSNALRHGQPTRVDLSLESDARGVVLTVSDDGRGMDSSRGPGVGLRTMRHRAHLASGTFEVRPLEGGGTLVRVVIPCS